jgi:Wiskott-Aldrich syndrome protein
LDGTRGVIWEHELYQNFDYFQDRPYFHSFPGDVRLSSVALVYPV